MSVSAYNQSVAPSLDNASLGDAKPRTERSAAASTVQVTVGVNFSSQSGHCGPIFAGPPPRPLPGNLQPNPGPPPRPLPENLRPNPGPPPRPNPTLPDPYYSKQSNEQLAQRLLNNYGAFKGNWFSPNVTTRSLQNVADRPMTGNPYQDSNIKLAKELLRRPGLLQSLDRNGSTGALDGRLTKDDIASFVRSDNPLKLSDDQQLVQQMLSNFNALKGGYFSSTIKLRDLNARAMQPLTGNPYTDHLTQLSKEVLARSDLMSAMDNIIGWQRDGRISRQELYALLR
ncbi:hypothetical protein [Pseudomonas cedrina]|uniref:hypothetical protein n=1 Tax=Pseudomonas cedrina TaxID=651740 RepID=UPI00278789BC|nr:hypothetical protein [Pseudomonas cedrina]MDQ0655080.1 hypothetical protein [Pseudomonas cedrina]